MSTPGRQKIRRRVVGNNVWLSLVGDEAQTKLVQRSVHLIKPDVLATEELVGEAMFAELEAAARSREGDLVVILLDGHAAQSLHRLLGQLAETDQADQLFSRLHVFTQDALAPMRMESGLSFVRDFERLLGPAFFKKIKSFTSMRTGTDDLEGELARYIERLEALGGIDIFFLGHGPELGGASHLVYIKPGSGAMATDVAGLIPVSASILEHHIAKFKAGGSAVTETDEAECRAATHILTLGPAAILRARRVVQSIVDASTAPAKRVSYRRVLEAEIASDPAERATQLDENPGLWTRLHPNLRSIVLPDLLAV
jgi:6-phosphogluconolactonase/glucosamine-6-phosphate isomerase/deaminase